MAKKKKYREQNGGYPEVRLNKTYSNTTYYVGNNAAWYNIIPSVYNTQKNVLWLPVIAKHRKR